MKFHNKLFFILLSILMTYSLFKVTIHDQYNCNLAISDNNTLKNTELNREWQNTSEYNLDKWIKKTNSKRGLVVGIDIKTGELLSVVSINPNPREKDCKGNKNLMLTAYEPGSVMKPLTLSIAFNEKVINSETMFKVDYKTKIDGKEISNAKDYLQKNFRAYEIIEASLNNGAIEIAKKLGNNKIDKQARIKMFDYFTNTYNVGKRSNLNFKSEDKGYIPNPIFRQDNEYRYATISFGLGLTMTPIQLLNAYRIMLSGENDLPDVHLVNGTYNDSKSKISNETSNTLIKILEGAFKLSDFKLPKGYIAGGKTGTSYTPLENGTYKDGLQNDTGTYIGFIGKNNPRYLILTRLDEPKNKSFASGEAKKLWWDIVYRLIKDNNIN